MGDRRGEKEERGEDNDGECAHHPFPGTQERQRTSPPWLLAQQTSCIPSTPDLGESASSRRSDCRFPTFVPEARVLGQSLEGKSSEEVGGWGGERERPAGSGEAEPRRFPCQLSRGCGWHQGSREEAWGRARAPARAPLPLLPAMLLSSSPSFRNPKMRGVPSCRATGQRFVCLTILCPQQHEPEAFAPPHSPTRRPPNTHPTSSPGALFPA